MRFVLWAGLLAGCTGDTTTDVTDTGACTPQTFEDDCKDYDAPGARCAELGRFGNGTVTNYQQPDTSFDVSESIQFIDFASKLVVCELTYDLVQGADRSEECEGKTCAFAFEYTITNSMLTINEGDACDGLLAAIEICDASDLDGVVTVRGYDPLWEGHAQVIWTTSSAGDWRVYSFAKFLESTNTLTYSWFDGFYPY